MSSQLCNAAKYGGKNDTIDITVVRNGNRLRVSVSDHGPGIPEDFHSRVFEKFAMSQATPVNKKKGRKVQSSGLGLSIAKAIIEQHGGIIGFDTTTASQSSPQTDSQTSGGASCVSSNVAKNSTYSGTSSDTTNGTFRGTANGTTLIWFELPTL